MMRWEDSLKKLSATVSDLDQASLDRLEDSRVLIAAGRPASAIASGLYALEIRLKVLICHRLNLPRLPRAFEIHDLEALLLLSGLRAKLDDPSSVDVKLNWGEVVSASGRLNELRYSPDRVWTTSQAVTFLGWLEDPDNGVIPWLLNQP
jgi:hypothetical protein